MFLTVRQPQEIPTKRGLLYIFVDMRVVRLIRIQILFYKQRFQSVDSIINMNIFSHKKNKIHASQHGFTLLEALIGISIVVIAITATFGATQSGLKSAIESRDQITAFYLAQEGIEYIRNARDTNTINSQPWLTGIAALASDPCFFGSACAVDAVKSASNPPQRCTQLSPFFCTNIRQDLTVSSATYGMYGYTTSAPAWTLTNFNRQIQLTSINANEIIVTVTMRWGTNSSFVAKESLLNWQ